MCQLSSFVNFSFANVEDSAPCYNFCIIKLLNKSAFFTTKQKNGIFSFEYFEIWIKVHKCCCTLMLGGSVRKGRSVAGRPEVDEEVMEVFLPGLFVQKKQAHDLWRVFSSCMTLDLRTAFFVLEKLLIDFHFDIWRSIFFDKVMKLRFFHFV